MPDTPGIILQFRACLASSSAADVPFRHWLLDRVLPDAVCDAITALPLRPQRIGDTQGKRETHNSSRLFFGPAQQGDFPVCGKLAAALQDVAVIHALETGCEAMLSGGFLRIEYCLDTAGFWLEPHTDIGAKLFTMLIYLADEPRSEAWGTDLLDPQGNLVARAPFRRNTGLIFIPDTGTWHGFAPRPISGVRRSLIVNYVKPEWRSRHELAFPDSPVTA